MWQGQPWQGAFPFPALTDRGRPCSAGVEGPYHWILVPGDSLVGKVVAETDLGQEEEQGGHPGEEDPARSGCEDPSARAETAVVGEGPNHLARHPS